MSDYPENIQQYPVKPDINPGDIKSKLPSLAPDSEENSDMFLRISKILFFPE